VTLPHGLRAFAHRNFRLFIAGQGTSQIGSWLQLIATSWLMFELTHSTLMLGLAAFALQIPFLLIGPVAGVFLDRLNVRRVLFVTNALAFTQSLVMLTLVAGGWIQPWHLVVGNLVMGLVNACDAPGRQSLLVHLVDRREDLANAIALNGSVMNGARFIGPMLGGSVIGSFGVVSGFALNAVLRVSVVVALILLRVDPPPKPRDSTHWARQLATGARYAYGFLPSRAALLMLASTSFLVQPYSSLMPWFASQRFHGDAHTLGLLTGAAGCGAMTGMILLAWRPGTKGLFKQIAWSAALAGAGLIAFSATSVLWVALILLFAVGMGTMLTAASTNIVLQTIVPDALRGRVASLYVASFLGMAPLGALFGGWFASHVTAPVALACCGGGTLLAALVYWRQYPEIRRQIIPVYRELGIIAPH